MKASTPAPSLSILVVSYNTRDLTLACLESVFRETHDVSFEIIVIDNASTDGSGAAIRAQFPDLHLVESTKNLGFAGANNHAAALARGDTLLLLNPDTVVLEGAIDKLYQFFQGRDGAICGGRTLFEDRSLNPSSCWARPTPWSVFCLGVGLASLFRKSKAFNPEAMATWKRDSNREVDIISGCFLMIATETWQKLGGFDLDYFMYGEDFDLCLRAQKIGVPSWVCAEAEIIHYAGASETVRSDKMVRLFTARCQLYRRHWPPSWQRFGVLMHDFWAATRSLACALLGVLKPRFRESGKSWRDVWRRREVWRGAR